jgi:protein-tyrosine-phosphatase
VLDRPLARSVMEWGRIATRHETWDGAALDDPLPIAHEIVDYVRERASPRERLQLRRSKRAAIAAWQRPLGSVRRVLVLCNGNLCRSPYAGVALGHRLHDVELGAIEVRSGGFFGPIGRPAPPHVVAVAARRGVELARHRSRVVDDAELAWADLVVIMDRRQELIIAALHDDAAERVRWLGGLAPRGREPTIVDPIDFGAVGVAEVLDHMDSCIDLLVDRIVAYHHPG